MWIFLLALYALLSDGLTRKLPDEQALFDKLFRKYDSNVRPVFNATHNVAVEFSLSLVQLVDMDEKNQVLVTNVWLVHTWTDERMKWEPAEYNGLKMMRIPARNLWLPDIVLYNNADDFTTGYMQVNAMVSADGNIFWSPPARLKSSCKVDITYFPFDKQMCRMKFGSWTYDQAQVDIINKTGSIDMTNYITNGEWHLLASEIQRNEVVYPIGDEVFPDVTVMFKIQRRILYYILNILLPCVWLNMLSFLAFYLPPDAGEKITLGITVLLSYSVFMLLIAESMPSTSEFVPLIGIYLSISMAVTAINVLLTVFVLKLHHCGPTQAKVHPWIRTLVLNWLAKFVNCDCSKPKKKWKSGSIKGGNYTEYQLDRGSCPRLGSEYRKRSESPVAELCHTNNLLHHHGHNNQNQLHSRTNSYQSDLVSAYNRHQNQHHQQTTVIPPPPDVQAMASSLPRRTPPLPPSSASVSPAPLASVSHDQQRLELLQDILEQLKNIVAKQEADEEDERTVNEWQNVAEIVDRALFRLFFAITVITTVVLLVFVPMSNIEPVPES